MPRTRVSGGRSLSQTVAWKYTRHGVSFKMELILRYTLFRYESGISSQLLITSKMRCVGFSASTFGKLHLVLARKHGMYC